MAVHNGIVVDLFEYSYYRRHPRNAHSLVSGRHPHSQ